MRLQKPTFPTVESAKWYLKIVHDMEPGEPHLAFHPDLPVVYEKEEGWFYTGEQIIQLAEKRLHRRMKRLEQGDLTAATRVIDEIYIHAPNDPRAVEWMNRFDEAQGMLPETPTEEDWAAYRGALRAFNIGELLSLYVEIVTSA